MAGKTQRVFGIIGRPLTHSFSPTYFNEKFEAEGIDARYLKFELPDIGDFMEIVAEYPNLAGLNVTIPYKQDVMDYMDSLDPAAEEIGAVNVIKITYDKNGQPVFRGYNSDSPAFADTLRQMVKEGDKALILGTGGASKAVAYGLRILGVESVKVSRRKAPGQLTYEELTPEVMSAHRIIVNTTPVGMYPHVDDCPPIPYGYITPSHLCYDLIYNPDVTLFMKKSAEMGATTKNGLEMLLLQAFISWQIWNDEIK